MIERSSTEPSVEKADPAEHPSAGPTVPLVALVVGVTGAVIGSILYFAVRSEAPETTTVPASSDDATAPTPAAADDESSAEDPFPGIPHLGVIPQDDGEIFELSFP